MKNSLADIHPELVCEWSDSNLPLTPDTVTYGSNKEVWWKGKISERAIDGKGCRECEKEYQSVFPQLAVGYYAAKKGLKVLFHSDTALGIPLEIYAIIPLQEKPLPISRFLHSGLVVRQIIPPPYARLFQINRKR